MDTTTKLTALVTGASSGLGESFAKKLAARGHDLVLVSENSGELARVKRNIEARSACTVSTIVMDLFKPDSADRLFDICREKMIQADILINCAGIFVNVDREMDDICHIENVINLHVLAVTKLCFLFGKEMIGRKRGYILNISSIAAEFADPASLSYGPTKRYVLSMSEALHCEWKQHNIKVTCITPGGINTNFFKANQVFLPSIIRRTLISPDRCAEAGLKALFRGRFRVTPGITGKLQSIMLKIFSRPMTYGLIKKIYFSMKNSN
ncbi:MAG TPA: SDR family NAD(P)-dependent oxidoreductase [Spirochaetota bacterium]|nr:SDR family NAD(P)-dependent oxidoreductase [Spirochaetota bacterium]HOD13437.1 SDR family NAD(P)-dependent oxidoreductase [Spirochaetota bacterium]HPG49386.1 SDR family NAD(P)-dependent oxidoreductase [Spirochaetota bacterium]HPN10597.1 SDR family NAD(P)-dependent oxidoreductase [Spirochaetota bacterium]